MPPRTLGLLDSFLGEIDKAIKVLTAPAHAGRTLPPGPDATLAETDRALSARLMRVNHAGEVAAQALYQGQALTARSSTIASSMRRAAAEEMDHLAWCETRLQELNGHTSLFNPLWYAGSFVIGALAGALGDRTSLGFIAETETQVEAHLREHSDRLPAADQRSRAILDQMSRDEASHGAQATSLGADRLPFLPRFAMRLTSKVMTRSSFWV